MDNPNYHNPAVPNFDKVQPVDDDLDKPIPLDLDEPIPLSPGGPEKANVSHTPLNLGGPAAPARQAPATPARQAPATPVRQARSAQGAAATPAAAPVAQIQMPKGAVKPAAAKVVSSERITGVKTFFTKLHPGALEFLDEQICTWLKKNPGVSVKRTNITTGDVQSKKTEPNIIITIWY